MAGMGIDKTRGMSQYQCLPQENGKSATSNLQSINVSGGQTARGGTTKTSSGGTTHSRNLNPPQKKQKFQKLHLVPDVAAAGAATKSSESLTGVKIAGVVYRNNFPLNDSNKKNSKAPSSQQQNQNTVNPAQIHASRPRNGNPAQRSRSHHWHQRSVQVHQQAAFWGMPMRYDAPASPTAFNAVPYPSAYDIYYPNPHFYPPPHLPSSPPPPPTPAVVGGSPAWMRNGGPQWEWNNHENSSIAPPPAQLALMTHCCAPMSQLQPGHQSNFQAYSSYPTQSQQQTVLGNYAVNQGSPRPGQAQAHVQAQTPRMARSRPTATSVHVGGPYYSHQRCDPGNYINGPAPRTQFQAQAYPHAHTRPLRPWAPEFVPIASVHGAV